MLLDRARLSLPCFAEGYLSAANGWWPSRLLGAALVSYEYRVFMVQQAKEWTFLHVAAERLRDGVVLEVERPGSELDGLSVIVYSVLTHPLDGRPGIAYARESPRLVVAHGLDGDPAGRSTSPTRGNSMSVQGGAQEPESPDQPDEQIPGQPGTMPGDPSPAPEAPDMPSDPDRDPSQSPPDESDSS
jgi:hypothetical protein